MNFCSTISVQDVPGLVTAAARAAPETIAVAGDETLDYRTLVGRAKALSETLGETGVREGSLVAVCLPRSADQIVAALAAWFAGAAYLPLDPALPTNRLAKLIEQAKCSALVAAGEIAEQAGSDVPLVKPGRVISDDTATRDVAPDALAYVIYTSGSTGVPKGVEVTHANLAALTAWHREAFKLKPGTRTSHLAGLGFDAAVWEVWPTLASGGTLLLADDTTRLDPHALRDWLVLQHVEVAFAPTALAEPMARMAWPPATALRTLLTGAERLKVRPLRGQPFELVNNYGPTESTVVATSGIVSPEGDALPSIGLPIPGTTVYLLDADGHEAAAGEVFVGGAQVASGYRNDPVLTAARFVEHPEFGRLYRTGDLAEKLANGELAFRGRADDQIKIRGHRVEPAEVAAELGALPGVDACAVTSRDGELVAYVVEKPEAGLTALALRSALAGALPDYMVPAHFAALTGLPLTANGKVDFAALPDPASHALPDGASRAAPVTPTQHRLLAIVAELIGRDDIGIDDDFFLLGGHSLLGTQLVMRAREAFGVEVTLYHLFEARTVTVLAETVERLVVDLLDTMSDEDIRRMSAA